MAVVPVLVVALLGSIHYCAGQGYGQGSYGNSTYGRGSNQMVSTQYNTGLPSNPDLPFHSHNYPTTNQGCFPNIIAKPVPADPLSRLGRYYEYRMAYKDGQAYNLQYTTKVVDVGLDYLPGTYTPIVHTVQDDFEWITLQQSQSYGSGSQGYGAGSQGYGAGASSGYGSSSAYGNSYNKESVKCNYNWIDIWSRYDGVDFYELFDPDNGPVNPISQTVYLLYLEPGERGWEIQYQCDSPNEQTYKCDKVTVYVNTRVRPDYMSAEEQYKMDETINNVLRPYCFSTVDLQKVIYRDDLSIDQCSLNPSEAFRNHVIGSNVGLQDRTTGPGAAERLGQRQGQGYAQAQPQAYAQKQAYAAPARAY